MEPQVPNGALLRKVRIDNALTAEDVGEMVGVTTRQVSAWESGSQPMPRERLELLLMKLDRRGEQGPLVTVLSEDGKMAIDVVSERNFAGFRMWNDGTATIKSVAIDRSTGRPYMHATSFAVDANEHVVRAGMKWRRDLAVGVRSEFEPELAPVDRAMADWIVNRVRDHEARNPEIRVLKDRIAAATEARDFTSSPATRLALQREIDAAMAALSGIVAASSDS